jgi:hypothetical protein
VPALILLYSGIDIASFLDTDNPVVHERFATWVEKYLLAGSSLKCSANDLYGARCGLVHSYSPVSTLSKTGKAVPIGYAWKPSTAARLEKLIEAHAALSRKVGSKPEYVIAVQGEYLIESFRAGLGSFLRELELDPVRVSAACVKAGDFLAHLPTETAEDMLTKAEAVLGGGDPRR